MILGNNINIIYLVYIINLAFIRKIDVNTKKI